MDKPIILKGYGPDNKVEDVTFEDCWVAGKPLKGKEDANITVGNYVTGVRFVHSGATPATARRAGYWRSGGDRQAVRPTVAPGSLPAGAPAPVPGFLQCAAGVWYTLPDYAPVNVMGRIGASGAVNR